MNLIGTFNGIIINKKENRFYLLYSCMRFLQITGNNVTQVQLVNEIENLITGRLYRVKYVNIVYFYGVIPLYCPLKLPNEFQLANYNLLIYIKIFEYVEPIILFI